MITKEAYKRIQFELLGDVATYDEFNYNDEGNESGSLSVFQGTSKTEPVLDTIPVMRERLWIIYKKQDMI